jgi:hypothetical protein
MKGAIKGVKKWARKEMVAKMRAGWGGGGRQCDGEGYQNCSIRCNAILAGK